MKLKNLVKACSKDRVGTALLYVHVTRTDDEIVCEATNGHMLVQLTYTTKDLDTSNPEHQGISQIKPGLYRPADWTDLVCKGRVAEPITTDNGDEIRPWPDTDQIIPKGPFTTGAPEFGICITYVGILGDIIGGHKNVKVSGVSANGPARFDSVGYDDARMVAVIMPVRV